MNAWEMALLAVSTGFGGAVARFLIPDLGPGRWMMVLGLSFWSSVAAMFAQSFLDLPLLITVDTPSGPFLLGWALIGATAAGLAPGLAFRYHQATEPQAPTPRRITLR